MQWLSASLLVRWGNVAGVAVLTIVPTILLFSLMQERVVEGLTAGAVKEE
jgi:glycerol transport system permease protein